MLSCVRIFVKRNYPGLHFMVINCEILGVIYTFFGVLGNENTGSGRVEEFAGSGLSLRLVMGRKGAGVPFPILVLRFLGLTD